MRRSLVSSDTEEYWKIVSRYHARAEGNPLVRGVILFEELPALAHRTSSPVLRATIGRFIERHAPAEEDVG